MDKIDQDATAPGPLAYPGRALGPLAVLAAALGPESVVI